MLGHLHEKGGWKISYGYMNMAAEGNLSGIAKVDNDYILKYYSMSPQRMRMNMHMLMGMYGISDRFSIMLMLHYNTLSMNMKMLPESTHMHMHDSTMNMMTPASTVDAKSHSSGLGDTKLHFVYSMLNKKAHYLLLSGGINIPTGNIHIKGSPDDMMYGGKRLPYMMQLGSGSFDIMPGIIYLLNTGRTSFSVQFTSVIHPFYNSLGYHLGNEYTLNTWLAHRWFSWISTSIRTEANASGTIAGSDPGLSQTMEPAASPLCYGGRYANVYAGLNFYINKRIKNSKISFEYGLPFYQNLNGPQLSIKSSLTAGWLIGF